MHNLRSYSIDMITGLARYSAQLARNEPTRYMHVLVPSHELNRFESLWIPTSKHYQARMLTQAT